MSDPYRVLGVSQNASDDEVKTAYRELARKYHPDSYADNPLADLAAEKMKEINEAYDRVMDMRRGRDGGDRQPAGQGGSQFWDIRRMINEGRVTEAEELLDGVQQHMRDAEWYFLKGSVQYTRGWMEQAYENFSRACEMNPGNSEYRAALNQLGWQRKNGRPGSVNGGGHYGRNDCGVCDICAAMWCADCCCGCMGGDFIRCC
ncbi:MAG: J domain-containing protein [Oscillospiraceae bacterium]|jgi:curved DNA-binding protein CbpA|nr:J domain-containing protein [Oscillospiraceae bacterium]